MTAARWLLTMTLALAATAAWAGDLPFYAALHTRVAPHLDGRLDDLCWQTAERSARFVAIGGAPVDVTTRVMVCWDKDALYAAFICPEPLMADLQQRLAADGLKPFDESIELFLDPAYDRYTYLQLRVDVLGHRDTHRRNDPEEGLDGQWSAAVQRGPAEWSVEMAVPFAMLGTKPGPATVWSGNANRQRIPAGGKVEWTCWSDTRGGFHSPARFGHLLFTGYRPWLRQHFRQRLAAQEEAMGDLVLRFPEVAPALVAEMRRLDGEQARFLEQIAARPFAGEQDCRVLYDEGLALQAEYERALEQMRLMVIRDVLL